MPIQYFHASLLNKLLYLCYNVQMNILKVSKQNIDAVMGYTESIEEKSLGLDASFIYQTSRTTLAQLKSRVAIEPNLAKQLKRTVYGTIRQA